MFVDCSLLFLRKLMLLLLMRKLEIYIDHGAINDLFIFRDPQKCLLALQTPHSRLILSFLATWLDHKP